MIEVRTTEGRAGAGTMQTGVAEAVSANLSKFETRRDTRNTH
ncbi:hypothetical protein TMEC50S_00748 [Thauera mechernichensis]